MKKNLITAVLMTLVTTILLGLVYPLVVTGLAQVIFPDQANGSLMKRADGTLIGSRLIGQPLIFSVATIGCGRIRLRCRRIVRL
jgi:K+-transporting ATPase ATPase C chain